jgi:hypothetical protein
MMNIQDYIFKPGDVVIAADGRKGKITTVCTCISCLQRGFNEPFWVEDADGGSEQCISKFEAQGGFSNFYQIGDYYFGNLDKGEVLQEMASCEHELSRLKRQLAVIEGIENGDNNKDARIHKLEHEVKELRRTLDEAYRVIGQFVENEAFTED